MSLLDDFKADMYSTEQEVSGETQASSSYDQNLLDTFKSDFYGTTDDGSLPYDGGFEDAGAGYADAEASVLNEKSTLPSSWEEAKTIGGDQLVAAGKTAINIGNSALGLIDAPTAAPAESLMASAEDEALYNILQKSQGGNLGRLLESAGYKPNEALAILDSYYSDKYKAQQKGFSEADGISGKFKFLAENPAMVANPITESLGPVLAGNTIGKFLSYGKAAATGGTLGKVLGLTDDLLEKAPRLATWLSGAIGEGAVAAGSNIQELASKKDGRADTSDYLAGMATGLTTSAIGAMSNKLQSLIPGGDVDTFLMGKLGDAVKLRGARLATAMAASGFTEGLLEEMPQSVVEASILNLAQGKPWYQGLEEVGVLSTATGAAMGAGVHAKQIFLPKDKAEADQILEDAGIDPNTGELNAKGQKDGVGTTAERINDMLGINRMSMTERLRRYEDIQDAYMLTPEEREAMSRRDKEAGAAAVEDLKSKIPGPKSAKESAETFQSQPFSQLVDDTQEAFDQEMSTVDTVQNFLKEASTPKAEAQPDVNEPTPAPETPGAFDIQQYQQAPPEQAPPAEPVYAPDQITNPELISEIPYELQQQAEAPQAELETRPTEVQPASPAPAADVATARAETVDTKQGRVFKVVDANGTRLVKPEGASSVGNGVSVDKMPDAQGNHVYYHDDTGAAIAKNSNGKWVVDGTTKEFDTVGQASRALSTNPQLQQEVVQSYEATGAEGLATTTSPEAILEAKDSGVRRLAPATTPKQATTGGTRRRVVNTPKKEGPQEGPQQAPDSTTVAGDRIVSAILENDPQGVADALAEFPQSSHKAIVRAAGEIAREKAFATGEYDSTTVEETLQEVAKFVSGKYTKKSDIQWKAEEGMTGFYQGTDPRSGKTYSLYETRTAPVVNEQGEEVAPGKTEYVISEGKNVLVSGAKSVQEAKAKMQEFVSRETEAQAAQAGYSMKKLNPGDAGWTSRLTQYRVVDSRGNEVPAPDGAVGFEGKKAAQAHLDQLSQGKTPEAPSKGTKRKYAQAAKDAIKAYLEKEKAKIAESRSNTEGAPSAVRMIELTPEEKAVIEARINARISSDFELEQEDFGPLIAEEVRGDVVLQLLTDRGSKYAPLLQKILDVHGPEVFNSIRFTSHLELSKRAVPSGIKARLFAGGSWYDSKHHTVYYSPAASERSLAHELYHGLTIKAYQDLLDSKPNSPIVTRFRGLFQAFREEMIRTGRLNDNHLRIIRDSKTQLDLMRNMRGLPSLEQKMCYMLHSDMEFISVSMTEQDVQSLLKSVASTKGERKTLWSRFVASVKSLFGGEAGGDEASISMLEDLIDVTNEMVAHQTSLVLADDGSVFHSPVRDYDQEYDENNPNFNIMGDLDKPIEDRIEAMKRAINENPAVPSDQKKMSTKILDTAKDTLLSVSDELMMIDPTIAHTVASTETSVGRANAKATAIIKKIQQKMVKLKGDDRMVFNNALANGRTDVRDHYLDKYGAKDIWMKELQPILDEIRTGMIETGMLGANDTMDNWFPRRVQDLEGLIQAIHSDKERSLLKNEIEAVKSKTGLSEEDAVRRVISTVLSTGRMTATLRMAKSAKDRSITHVKPEWQGHYVDFLEAVANHVEESNEAIAWRRMIGKTSIPQAKSKIAMLTKALKDAKTQEEIDDVTDVLNAYMATLEDMQKFAEQSIPDMVHRELQSGNLSKTQLDRVIKLIRVRITQKGITSKAIRFARDASLGLTLGDALNTVTQITDAGWIVNQTNLKSTLQGFLQVIRGKADIKYTDFDFSRSLTEFRTSSENGSFFSLPALFKRIGFQQLDAAMKMTNIQAHILYGRSQVKTPQGEAKFREKYQKAWGKEMTDSVIANLKTNIVNEDTITYAITELAKVNPIFLSSMPVNFNRGANARIAYTLTSYTIKQFGYVYRESIHKVATGKGVERLEGLKNLAVMALIAGLTQAGVGELKEFLKDPFNENYGIGDPTFLEKFADGVLSLFFMSRYKIQQAGKRDWIESVVNNFVPPSITIAGQAVEDARKAVTGEAKGLGDIKTLRNVPAIIPGIPISPGRITYYMLNTDKPALRSLDNDRKEIFAKAAEGRGGSVSPEVATLVKEYNAKAKLIEGAKMITPGTLERARARARKNTPERKELFLKLQDYVTKGKPIPEDFRDEVRKYNNGARTGGYDPITPSDIDKARKQYAK